MKILNWKTGFSRCYFNFFFQPIRRCSSRSRDMTKPLDQYYSLRAHLTFYFTFFSGFRRNFLVLRWLKKKKKIVISPLNEIWITLFVPIWHSWLHASDELSKMSTGKWQVLWSPNQQDKFITYGNEICLYKVTRSQVIWQIIYFEKKEYHTGCGSLSLTLASYFMQLLWTEPRQLWGGDSGFDRS